MHPAHSAPIFNCVTPDSVSLASLARQLAISVVNYIQYLSGPKLP